MENYSKHVNNNMHEFKMLFSKWFWGMFFIVTEKEAYDMFCSLGPNIG